MQPVTFKILVVEDDPDDRWMIDDAFKSFHIEADVKKFITGIALLDYLNKLDSPYYPSVIVLDNFLPGMEARQLLTLIKHDDRFSGIPVVVYSTSLSPSIKKELMSLGAEACYEKGFSKDDLLEIAKKISEVAMLKSNGDRRIH